MGLTVKLLANDLSIHGQFYDLGKFHEALDRVMVIRKTVQQHGRELYCHRNFVNVQVTREMRLHQAIQKLTTDRRRSVMQWLTRHEPFWEDERLHGEDDWLECKGNIVTDTAMGEAAYRCLDEIGTSLVSLIPSSWDFSPAVVTWYKRIEVVNYRDVRVLEAALHAAPTQITSWNVLADMVRARCTQLTFSSDCFNPLQGYPLVFKAAQDILSCLKTLDRFKICFDSEGRRTAEGHELYTQYFTGERARFSDSSDTEKSNFRSEITFPHPDSLGESLFCPWHGKINYHPPLRIHFSWPVTAAEPLYVVYVGPKVTRR